MPAGRTRARAGTGRQRLCPGPDVLRWVVGDMRTYRSSLPAGLGPVAASAACLIGREADLALLRPFAAAPDGEVLLVTGGPGMGKTALLDEAACAARSAGCQVIRAAGVQFAADLSFGALNQLLLPFLPIIGQLRDSDSREALSALCTGTGGPDIDRLVLTNALRSLLCLAAGPQPVLLIIDDLHWLDRPTALVLGLMARRLAGTRIGLLGAARWDADNYFDMTGLPGHDLQPIGDQAAASLLDRAFPRLAPQVQRRLLTEAAGNPLALLELPAALTSSQRAGLAALPAVLPASERIQQLFAPRITALPRRARQALLTAALEGTGDLRMVEAVLSAAGSATRSLNDLAAAERSGLVQIDESAGRVLFRHPLIRSAVVELSASDDRRRAHTALATVLADQPDRQAWHLAYAAAGPDEKTASLLASAAYGVLRRGDAAGAVAALTRAADLSPQAPDRARRLAEAAYIAGDVTGELRRAPELLAKAIAADPELRGTLQAACASSFVLLNGEGDVAAAHRLLVSAIKAGGHGYDAGDTALIEALWTLVMVCFFSGRPESWVPFREALARLRPTAPLFLSLCARTFADPARTGAAALPDLTSAILGLTAETDPAMIVRIGIAAAYAERLPECRAALSRVIHDGRKGGAVASAISALLLIGMDDVWTGLWDEADGLFGEGLELCEAHGYELLAWPARWGQALLFAARGEQEASHRLADQMMRWAVPRGVRAVQVYARHAMALAALSRGDFDDAYRQATAISQPDALASHTPGALWTALDLVEAAARSGRLDKAAAHARAIREAGFGRLSPRFAAVEFAATALSETGGQAAATFEQALAVPGSERWTFDRARIQLLAGERLRQDRAPARAREHLTVALDAFVRLGARPWAERAAAELRAAGPDGRDGGGAPRPGSPGRGTLTAREHEIALLAATGLSNEQIGGLVQELVTARRADDPLGELTSREREVLALMAEGRSNAGIGQALYVSEGTVEKHVHSIMMKLRLPDSSDVHRRVLAVLAFLGRA